MSTTLRHRATGAEIIVDGDEQVAYWQQLGYRAADQKSAKPVKKSAVKKAAVKKR